jgi:hypothetical protein
VDATAIIRGFELEAVVVFVVVGAIALRAERRAGRATLLASVFAGSLAVALVGDPIANWGLTALYSDTFRLLPRWMGLGLSPAQSWACVFAYPWCFPMLAYAGRWVARRAGFSSALAGFAAGALVGGAVFTLSVPLTFVPNRVIVYQQAPPWPLTLRAGTPEQVQLLDVLGVATFIGLFAAVLMPAPGASRLERWLPARPLAAAGFASAVLVAMFVAAFSPALVVRALGLDTERAFARSPFPTVPLYGQVEGYPDETVANFLRACEARSRADLCRCTLDAIRRRFTIDEYRAFEGRIARGDVPAELVAATEDCR